MNLFILDSDARVAAKYNCDVHCVKISLEAAQLLCTTFNLQNIKSPYKTTHKNNPLTKWVRQSKGNFIWTLTHGFALCREYTRRYGKVHKCQKVLNWCAANMHKLKFDQTEKTEHPQCFKKFPQCVVPNNPVQGYRNLYHVDKKRFAKWKLGNVPEWFK